MSPERRRRGQGGPSKGDLRERAILDAAERRLGLDGYEAMKVETIASEVGISRASLYFYFGSKQEVLTALVARTMQALAADEMIAKGAADATTERDDGGAETVRAAIDLTVAAWREHGTVMRAAVELGPMVPEIGCLWDDTVARFVQTMTTVARGAGKPRGPVDAEEIAHALCWMTERVLYRASVDGADLEHTADVCHQVWTSALGLAD